MNMPRLVAVRCLLFAGQMTVAVGVSSCSGGGAEGGCPETAAATCGGGDPTGFWQVKKDCQYLPTQPSQPLTYNEYNNRPPNAIVPPVQPLPSTNGDWCSGLQYLPSGIGEVVLWHPPAQLSSGSIWLKSDATGKNYQTELVFKTPATTHFTTACLQSGGVAVSCSQFQMDLDAFFQTPPALSQGISAIRCAPSSDGCDCSYEFEADVTDMGTWTASGDILYANSEQSNYKINGVFVGEYEPAAPTAATYCKSGTLTLTGNDGASLSGVLGLRTLTLQPAQPPAVTGDGGP